MLTGQSLSTPKTKIIKPKKTFKMRKLLFAGLFGIFALGMGSCGAGHTCDAYRSADYTKYKADHNKKIELVQSLIEAQK